ncbi:MAG: hypothetical protein JXB34_12360 [Bacteroidales bacterium]|nr:hypothetical protein [Bacteroidales bacterium]
MNLFYECKVCGWKGSEGELQHDTTESCAGSDTFEICPGCGSEEVYIVMKRA